MSSSKSSHPHFRKVTVLLIHPFATLVMKNARPSRKALERIRFIARVAVGLEPAFDNLQEPPEKYEIPSLGEDTEEEKYHQNVSEYLFALANDINRLEAIQTYLSFTNFLSNKLDDNGISVKEWLQYHYSNHILTAVSIYDTSLCLFNATARLNIKQSPRFERDIRSKIKGNGEYEDVKLSLDSIKNKVSQHRDPRNSFVHKSKDPHHDELLRIDIVDIYNLWGHYYTENSGKVIS